MPDLYDLKFALRGEDGEWHVFDLGEGVAAVVNPAGEAMIIFDWLDLQPIKGAHECEWIRDKGLIFHELHFPDSVPARENSWVPNLQRAVELAKRFLQRQDRQPIEWRDQPVEYSPGACRSD